jgi:hypothetical protein
LHCSRKTTSTALKGYTMARNRIIKPEFWSDVKIGRLSFGSRLLYIAMWNFADDYGILSASPRKLLGEAFENDESVKLEDVVKWISEIESVGCIKRFSSEGKEWFEIVKFSEHQHVKYKSTRMNPKPPEELEKDLPKVGEKLEKGSENLGQSWDSNVNANANANGNGNGVKRQPILDPDKELFAKACDIIKENLTLTDQRRQTLREIRTHHALGGEAFLNAVANLKKHPTWPSKSLAYFLDKKFDAINRVDQWSKSPPSGGTQAQEIIIPQVPVLIPMKVTYK